MAHFQRLSAEIVAGIIQRQPASKSKTAFAWQLAVGPVLARVTTVELTDGVLVVRSADARWTQEIRRAADVILPRLQQLLGPDAVRRLETRIA